LDKEVIARVIRSNLGQIRYCYERQLSANPDIYGKVKVVFTIGSGGGVTTQKIGNTTLKNAMVEGCMLRRIAGWKFPIPEGGTSVLVSYPFLFKSTN
jgi:outer membrane biosynthesis protein TonB